MQHPVVSLIFAAYVERGVEVKLLFSLWDHTKSEMKYFMKSLKDLDGIQKSGIDARFFKVPSFSPDQADIPFARVNHNKYMVTEKHGYIGKSATIAMQYTTG